MTTNDTSGFFLRPEGREDDARTLDLYNRRAGGRTHGYDLAIHTHATAAHPKHVAPLGYEFASRAAALAKLPKVAELLGLEAREESCNV